MVGARNERALSEVIGFILIIALLTVIMSLYMTYMVPANGRENEITHLNYIKQQFQDYKINTDALWINKEIGTTISQAITMGTKESMTSGSFLSFSLFEPQGSGGMMKVNPPEHRERINIGVVSANYSDPGNKIYVGIHPVPLISYINPANVTVGSDGTLDVFGNGFFEVSATVKSNIYCNGEILTTTFHNANHLSTTIPKKYLTKVGSVVISVENPQDDYGGGISNEKELMIMNSGDNPVPVISGVSPTVVEVGSPIPSAISIVSGSQTFFNGESGLSIVPDITGMAIVTTYNPPPGGGTSNGMGVLVHKHGETSPPVIDSIDPAYISLGGTPSITIKGKGFVDTIPKSVVLINGEERTPFTVTSNIIVYNSISSDFLEKGIYEIVVKNPDGKRSNSMDVVNKLVIAGIRSSSITIPMDNRPSHCYLGFISHDPSLFVEKGGSSAVHYNEFPTTYGAKLVNSINDITFYLNATPRIITSTVNPDDWKTEFSNPSNTLYNIRYSTDLKISVIKGNVLSVDNFTVKSNMVSGEKYTVDIFSPVYGIEQDMKYPSRFEVKETYGSEDFDVDSTVSTGFAPSNIYTSNRAMGALTYQSKNYYYDVSENFTYQAGGINVIQTSGASPIILPPIGISMGESGILNVHISDISIRGDDIIGGNSPVQISSTLGKITTPNLIKNAPNAKRVIIQIDPMDDKMGYLWINILKAIKKNAVDGRVPSDWIIVPDNIPPRLIIEGNPKDLDTSDIILDYSAVDMNVDLQGVAKSVSI